MARVGVDLIRGGACRACELRSWGARTQDGDEIAALQHKTAMVIHACITWNTVQRQPTRKPVSGKKDDKVVALEQFSFQNRQAL